MGAKRLIDLTGKKFGRLTVLSRGQSQGTNVRWNCQCECGNSVLIQSSHLRYGTTKSCGCLNQETRSKTHKIHGIWTKNQEIYTAYIHMKHRCYSSKVYNYKNYGGRGIKVCDRWLDDKNGLINFYNDMTPTWVRGLSLDRIDVNGDYSPENCKWSTVREQNSNKRTNIYLTYKNKTQCLADWSKELGINQGTLLSRKKLGWTDDEILMIPVRKFNRKIHE